MIVFVRRKEERKMTVFLICVVVIALALLLIGAAFKLTGAIIKLLWWLFVKLPVSMVVGGLGLCMCFTVIFFPIGLALLKAAGHILV